MENFQELMDFIVNKESKKTTGMICKRIELSVEQAKKENRDYLTFKEIEELKNQVKEVIYEQYRNIRDFIQTGQIVWEFKKKE